MINTGYTVIDRKNKIYAIEFSRLDGRTQRDLLQDINPEWGLRNVSQQWNPAKDRTLLNKENWMYPVMREVVPMLQGLTDEEFEKVELSSVVDKFNVGIKAAAYYIFEDEWKRRQAIREYHEWEKVQRTVRMLGYQSIGQIEAEINAGELVKALQKRYDHGGDFMMYISLFNYGFIQGKRAERARKRLKNPT